MTRSPRLLAVLLSLWFTAPLSAEALFLRGNSNGDDTIDIADPIHTLTYLFLGGDPPDCLDAADSNDSGDVDISDPVYTLGYLFLGGTAPLPPGPDIAGPDPTPDPLDCPEPEPITIIVLLPGEELPPGGGGGGGAGISVPAQAAGAAFEVRVVAVDTFFNVVESSSLPPDLVIGLESPDDPGAGRVPVPSLDTGGLAIASVTFTNLRAGLRLSLRPVVEVGGTFVLTSASTAYSVNPGPAVSTVVLLPGQMLRPGVPSLSDGSPDLDPVTGVVAGAPFGGAAVHPSTAFTVEVHAIDRHGNWNFSQDDSRVLLLGDSVFEPSTVVAATNDPGPGHGVTIEGAFDPVEFPPGTLVRLEENPASTETDREIAEVTVVVGGASITVDRLELAYTRPLVTRLDLDLANPPPDMSVGQRFGTAISSVDAATLIASGGLPVDLIFDGSLGAHADVGGIPAGQAAAAAIESQVRAQALDDLQRFAFRAVFQPEFGRYVLISGAPADADSSSTLEVLNPVTPTVSWTAFPASYVSPAALASPPPAATRFSQGLAVFRIRSTRAEPKTVTAVAIVGTAPAGPSIHRSSPFRVSPSAPVIESISARSTKPDGKIDTIRVDFSESIDPNPATLPPASSFSLVRASPGVPPEIAGGTEVSVSGDTIDVKFGSGLGRTDIQDLSVRIAGGTRLTVMSGTLDLGPRMLTADSVGPSGTPVLIDRAPPVILSVSRTDTDGDGAPDQLVFEFSEEIQFSAGHGVAIGTIMATPAALSVPAGATLTLRVDSSPPRTLAFGSATTGAEAIATRLQALLVQPAPAGFGEAAPDVEFENGRFILRSRSTGPASTVDVTGGTAAALLGFGGSHLEVPGTDADSPEIEDFLVVSSFSGVNLLAGMTDQDIVIDGDSLSIRIAPPPDGEEVLFYIADNFNGSFISDKVGNEAPVITNVQIQNTSSSSGFIRIRDTDSAPDDGRISVHPGVVPLHFSSVLIVSSNIFDVHLDLLSVTGESSIDFLEPVELPDQGPAADLFPSLSLADTVELVAVRASTEIVVRVTLTLDRAAIPIQIATDSAGRISREFTIVIENVAPRADLGPATRVAVPGTTVMLDGSSSFDPNGGGLSTAAGADFEWTIDSPSGARTVRKGSIRAFTSTELGAHRISLRVTDAGGAVSDPAEGFLIVTGTGTSQVPAAIAGGDRVRRVDTPVTLDGSASYDPDTVLKTFTWTQVDGPTVVFGGTSSVKPTFTPTVPGTYVFQLVVSDAGGTRPSAPDTVTVIVIDDQSTTPRYVPAARARLASSGSTSPPQVLDELVVEGDLSVGTGTLDFEWRQVGGPSVPFTTTGDALTFRPVFPSTYEFELVVTDSTGLASLPARVSVPVRAVGSENLGNNVNWTFEGGGSVSLAGSLTRPNGTPLAGARFHFVPRCGPPVVLVDEGPGRASFVPPHSGVYEFDVLAITPDGVTYTSEIEAAVSLPGNPLPVAVLEVTPGMTQIELDGSASTPTGVSHYFTQTSGLPTVLEPVGGDIVTFVPLIPGTYTFELVVVDSTRRLRSARARSLPVTLDTGAPDQPVLTSTTPASPSSDETPEVHGTAEPGATVEIHSGCGGPLLGSGIAGPSGAFSITVTVPQNATTGLRAFAVDSAGNRSLCSSTFIAYVEDSLAPGAPEVNSTTPSSPSSDETPVVHGTAEPGATVQIRADCIGPVLGAGTATAAGAFAIEVTVPENATTVLRAFAIDAAGNPSTCSSSFVSYVEDSMAPAPPEVTGTTPASPSSDETIAVEGTAEPGSTVEVYSGLHCSGALLGSSVAGAFGAFAVPVTVPENATTRLQARCIDRAGNVSACSSSIVLYVEDSLAPSPPDVLGTTPPSPSNDETMAVEGSAEPGSTVQVYATPGCSGSPIGSGIALASGVFDVPVTVPENATTRLHVRAVDAAGNVSACSSSFALFVEDSIPPPAPVLTGTTPRSPSSSTTFQVSGTGEALAAVSLHASGDCSGPAAATGTVSVGGTFSVEVTVAMDSVTTLRGTLRDAAGNVSDCSAGFTVENDSPPSVQILPPGADLKGCIAIEYTIRDTTSDRADIVVQWRLPGSPDFQRATLAAASSSGIPSEGVYGLTTSPGGTPHHFVWNSQADLGPKPAVDVTLRITPVSRIDGADGTATTLSSLDIQNGLALDAPLDLASTDPSSVEVADFDRDGRPDVVAANGSSGTVTVHLQSPPPLGFAAQPPVAVGLDPSSLAVADLDRDGDLDLAVASHGDSSVSALLGDGTGHLAAGSAPLGPCPGAAAVALADLDRDGRVDVVVANEASGDISVFLQDPLAGFGPAVAHVTGAGAVSLAIGDIDRDGRPDIAVANAAASTVSLLLQDPMAPGSFLAATNLLGSGPRCVWVEDLDDDGKLDLVTANPAADGVSVFRGRGDGAFDPTPDFWTGTGSEPAAVAAADLNDDGLPDLAVAASGTGDVRFLIQEGGAAIAFEDPPVTQATGSNPRSLSIGDFDRDGQLDVVVANRTSATLSVVRNTQEPRCEVSVDAGTSLDAGPSPESLAIGDFDRDGHLDLVVVDPPGSAVRLLDGAGNGVAFTGSTWPAGGEARTVVVVDVAADGLDDIVVATPSILKIQVLPTLAPGVGPPVAHAVGSNPVSIAAADWSHDGIPDLAVANQGSNDVSVLVGDAAGGFAPAPGSPLSVCAGPVSVAAGDLNGDSIPDLLVSCADVGIVDEWFGTGGGSFTHGASLAVAGRPVSIAVGDVDGDGKLDFATANELGGTVSVRLGNGLGSFADAAGSPVAVGGSPSSVAIVDLDGDARLDVVVAVAEAHHDRVVVFADDDPVFVGASSTRTGAGPSSIAIGDLNGDGRSDLAVGHTGGGGAQVFRGRGDGSFSSTHDFDASSGKRAVAIGDVNRDGRTDFVIADPEGDSVSLHIGDGRGGFGLPQTFATGDRPVSIAVGDLNRDGLQDLVVANSDSSTFTVHVGVAAGGFAPATPFPTAGAPHTVALGDVDRDGILDVAVSVPAARFVTLHRGDGAGSFLAPSHTSAGLQPRELALGDLDRDGILDLVVVDPAVSIVRVFKGDGTGAFVFVGTFGVGLDPTAIALGDLDGDGRLDLAVTNAGSNEVTVRLGDGLGGFGPSSSISTGHQPSSISIADVTGDGRPDILVAADDGAIVVHIQGGPLGYEPPVKIVAGIAVDGPGPLASGGTIRNNTGGCAVARFEHLGGPAVQRLAGIAVMVIPLGVLALLKRREKRRRSCGPGSSSS